MSSQREPSSFQPAQSGLAKVSVGQFAERFRGEVIPLSNTFGYFCASVPMSEEVREGISGRTGGRAAAGHRGDAAAHLYPAGSLSGALERTRARTKPKRKTQRSQRKLADFVVAERPAEGKQSWASQVSFENETVLVFALKEQDVAEYHYRLYRRLALWSPTNGRQTAAASYKAMIREELTDERSRRSRRRKLAGEADADPAADQRQARQPAVLPITCGSPSSIR